jgi:hypothetical protein
VGPTSILANDPLFSPCHPDRWVRHVRNRVNLCLDRYLLELQKITSEIVDLRFQKRKVIQFHKFGLKMVVLCYSLRTISMDDLEKKR